MNKKFIYNTAQQNTKVRIQTNQSNKKFIPFHSFGSALMEPKSVLINVITLVCIDALRSRYVDRFVEIHTYVFHHHNRMGWEEIVSLFQHSSN